MEYYRYKIGNFECGFYREDAPLSSDAVLGEVLKITNEICDSIPYYAYGDNEAAVRMIKAIHKIREKILSISS